MNQLYRALNMPKKRLIKKMLGHKEKYVVCVRNRKTNETNYTPLFQEPDCWYADPILQEYNGIMALFMERFEYKKKKGMIAYAVDKGKGFSVPETIIEESFHMSFPMTFIWRDSVFMIPETSADSSIRLYKSIEFPCKWEMIFKYNTEIPLVDHAVLSVDSTGVELIASEISKKNGLLVRFYRYRLEERADSGWRIILNNDYNKLKAFNYADRCAGKIIYVNDNKILPTQKSSKIDYGYCLNFRNVQNDNIVSHSFRHTITPNDVKINGIKIDCMIGIHTYSENERYQIIDVRYLE